MGRYWPGLGSNFRPEFKKLPRVVTVGRSAKFVSNMRNAGQVFGLIPAFNVQFADTGSIADVRGNGVPVFLRPTIASVLDQDGIIRPVLASEVRFQGLRRVQNLVAGHSNDLTNVNWAKNAGGTGTAPAVTANYSVAPDGTQTASRVIFNVGAGRTGVDFSRIASPNAATTGKACGSVWMKSNNGAIQTLVVRAGAGSSDDQIVSVTGTWKRFTSLEVTAAPAAMSLQLIQYGSLTTGDTVDISIWGTQMEDVTGQSIQTPADLVSVGIQVAPVYHGAGIDAVKYFPTYNNNVVQQNLIIQSQALDTGAWTKTRCTISADATRAPDNTLTADAVIEDATAGNSHVVSAAYAVTPGQTYTWSVYAKTGPGNKRWLVLNSDLLLAGFEQAFFDLATGTVSQQAFNNSAAIVNVGGGWYRCSVTAIARIGIVNAQLQLMLANASNGASWSYNGDAISGNYMWGVQFQPGLRASTYVATGAAAVSNGVVEELGGATIPTAIRLGYLSESAKTNLALQSDDFSNVGVWIVSGVAITANAVVSPDGQTAADKLAETAVNAEHFVNQAGINIAAGQPIVCTVYAKLAERNFLYLSAVDRDAVTVRGAHFNLSTGAIVSTEATVTSAITSMGNGWYRCSISYTLGAGASNPIMRVQVTADGATKVYLGVVNTGIYIWGAQVEQATFASSYIPTAGAAVARTGDQLRYTPTAPFLNSAQGALYAKVSILNGLNASNRFYGSDGASTNRIEGSFNAGGASFAISDGVAVGSVAFGFAPVLNTMYKIAGTWGPVQTRASLNGGAVGSDNPRVANLSGITTFGVGFSHQNVAVPLEGIVAEFSIYSGATLSDAQLQALTT